MLLTNHVQQPKKFLNAAAIRNWEAAKATGAKSSYAGRDDQSPPKTPIRPRNPRLPSVPRFPPETGNTVQGHTERHSNDSEPQKSAEAQSYSRPSIQSVSPALDTTAFPNVTVEISQPENLDEEYYSTYQSSSTQPATSLPSVTSNGHTDSKDSSSWRPDHSTADSYSTSNPNVTQVESTGSGSPPIYQASSIQYPAPRHQPLDSPGPGNPGSTIPDSQPGRHSLLDIAYSTDSTPQTVQVFSVQKTSAPDRLIAVGTKKRSTSDPEDNPGAPAKRFKSWVISSSSDSQASPVIEQQSQQQRSLSSSSDHALHQTSIQVPGSAEQLVSEARRLPTKKRDRTEIPQTQQETDPIIIKSIEEDSALRAPHSPSEPKLPLSMEGQDEPTSQEKPGQDAQQDKVASTTEPITLPTASYPADNLDNSNMTIKETGPEASVSRQTSGKPQIPPALKRPDLEIVTGKPAVPRPLKSPSSPLLIRHALSPKVPLSPAALQSPSDLQVSTPGVPSSRSARSPSNIPDKLPYQPQEEPSYLGVEPTGLSKDAALSIKGARISRQIPGLDGPASSQMTVSSPFTNLDIQILGHQEFVIPLSMPPRTQQQYFDTYRYYNQRIEKFLRSENVDAVLERDMNVLLERIGKVTTHMDLDGGGPSSQDSVDPEAEASYAESCSDKFKVLGAILETLKHEDIHIVIFAREGELLNYLETYLKAKEVSYTRADGSPTATDSTANGGQSHVTLLASRQHSPPAEAWPADLVIAFDETFDASTECVQAFRNRDSDDLQLAPVIHLIVYGSLEHINLCLPRDLEPNDRLQRLVYYMVSTDKVLGQLAPPKVDPSALGPIQIAEGLLEFISKGERPSDWIIPAMPPLENLPAWDSASALSEGASDASEQEKREGSAQYWPNTTSPQLIADVGQGGKKRPYVSSSSYSFAISSRALAMLSQTGEIRLRGFI